jgi:Flp pilus assembly protein TadB
VARPQQKEVYERPARARQSVARVYSSPTRATGRKTKPDRAQEVEDCLAECRRTLIRVVAFAAVAVTVVLAVGAATGHLVAALLIVAAAAVVVALLVRWGNAVLELPVW